MCVGAVRINIEDRCESVTSLTLLLGNLYLLQTCLDKLLQLTIVQHSALVVAGEGSVGGRNKNDPYIFETSVEVNIQVILKLQN